MKRKQKCDNDKRIENKKNACNAAASATGQNSLLCMFGNQKAGNSAANSNLFEKNISAQPTEKLVQYLADKQNEIDDDELKKFSINDETVWYRSKKLSVSWLLLSERCLEVKTERKDKKRWHLMICPIYKEYDIFLWSQGFQLMEKSD